MVTQGADEKYYLLMKYREIFISAFLVVAIGAIYWQVAGHGFINLDDKLYVVTNSQVNKGLSLSGVSWAFTTTHASNWHPLTWLSHMLDCQLFGLKPGLHHLVNVLFHIANTVLLFMVFTSMTGSLWKSAFVAVLFGLHPLHVESVAWISERKDVLSTFFGILTLLAYKRYTRYPGVKKYLPVMLFFSLGLMAKPMLVTLPFVLLLFDYWPLQRFQPYMLPSLKDPNSHQRLSFLRLFWEKIPLLLLSILSSAVTLYAQHAGGAVGSFEVFPVHIRIANAMVSYASYMGKMLWPFHLAVFYPHPLSVVPWWLLAGASLLLIIISSLAILGARKYPWFIVGWLWYLGTLVPVIGIVQVGLQAMADRYTYMPLIGLFVIIAWGVPELAQRLRYRDKALVASAGAIIVILMTLTAAQISYWKDDVSISQHAIDVTSHNYLAHNNLGLALESQGRTAEATEHFIEALKINPEYLDAQVNLGINLAGQGRIGEAIDHYTKALQIKPGSLEAHFNLGSALLSQGMVDSAIEHFKKATQIDPRSGEAHNGLGVALARKGDREGAIREFQEALRIDPGNVGAQGNLEKLLASRGMVDEASAGIKKAIEGDPGNAGLYVKLGDVYRRGGDIDKAMESYEKALSMEPGNMGALSNLAVVYAGKGEFDKALDVLKKVIEIKPESAGAYYNISCIYARQGKVDESVKWLKAAVEKGFKDWGLLKKDRDLESIRGAAYYEDLMKRHGSG